MMNKKYTTRNTLVKNITFYIVLFLSFFSNGIKAQGVDIIFLMDNSGSIDNTEWTNMTASVKSLIDNTLSCNPQNRAAVVHYGATTANRSNSKIYIESDFSQNTTALKTFARRSGNVGVEDYAPEAVSMIGNALDNIANVGIVSTQKNLNKLSTNKLVIFLFTDASRSYDGNSPPTASYLVSSGSNPFGVYNQFKINREATFVIFHAGTGWGSSEDTPARAAAAAIASRGGSYSGTVEANVEDPQGSGTKPRKAVMSNSFTVSSSELTTITDNICKSCAPTVEISAVTPPTQTVCLFGTAQALVSTAVGTGTLSYQWYSNTTNSTTGGTLITGANSASYNPPTSASGTKYYYVVVSDSYCEGKSTSAIVSVTVTANSCSTFDCETAGMFFSQGSGTNVTLHQISSTTNPFTYPALGSAAGYAYNAIGFNPVDGFIYGLKYYSNNLIRIDANGTRTDLGAVTGLPSDSYIAGEIDNLGNYYVKVGSVANTTMYKINIATLTATTITLTKSVMVGDFSFNPVDGLLYGVQTIPSAGAGKLLSINPATGSVNVIGNSFTPNNFTAMFGSMTGETFGIGHNGGFYQFNLTSGERVKISDSPSGSTADGAHCVNTIIKFNADLYATKTDNKSYYIPGTTTTYTVVVGNNGPFGSMGATVSDPVPTGIPAANVSYTATVSGGATTTVTGTQTGAINDVVGLPVGGKVTYTITVTVPLNFIGDLTNTVTVTPPSSTTDPDMDNNTATDIDAAACHKPSVTSGTALATNHGITALGRAGADNPDNWPMVRKGAWTILEAKTKGFVPNRLTDTQMTAIPPANLVEGMMIYNITQQCLMINTDGTATGWKCYGTPACPD